MGDHIYDTDHDVSKGEIVDLWSCGKPNIVIECKSNFTMHEKPFHPTNEVDL